MAIKIQNSVGRILKMANRISGAITWRPLGLVDIPRIENWFWNFADVALFDRTLPVPLSPDSLQNSWRKSLEHDTPPCAYWFIAEDTSGTPLGIAGLDSVNYIQGDAVLPFFVGRDHRKQGLATAMTISVLDLAFSQLRLHRVSTFYRDDNTATMRAVKKIGFAEEGRFREGWFVNGERKDTVVAGILSAEWLATRHQVIEKVADSCKLSFAPTCWKEGCG
ncbi:GNAT family N-acetyltransferase [Roseobacter sp. YSTF-M11]|uniref:GNAT family N-acetyltransferase n=1 Tax=Roseobacter insulae TaxID=2859783 RepID=A0A9X1K1D7_9RHOB|nr:GNAT family protein [Roseobacter insulae]MBW4707383.1 GNAT family N-acetyltransferase [Roseobacter insulae]